MLRLFVTMMGGPEDKAATIYLAMETQSAKTAAIVALANAHLSEENRDLLKAVLAVAKSRQKDRDRIAHGVWGESPNIPDALLLINQKDKIRTELSREYVLVYKESDFVSMIEGNRQLSRYVFNFRWIIEGHPANKDGSLYRELCAKPEIRERLDRQALQAQSARAG